MEILEDTGLVFINLGEKFPDALPADFFRVAAVLSKEGEKRSSGCFESALRQSVYPAAFFGDR